MKPNAEGIITQDMLDRQEEEYSNAVVRPYSSTKIINRKYKKLCEMRVKFAKQQDKEM